MTKLKDSGMPWIGLIPEHWDIVNVKRYFTSKKNIVGDEVEKFERLALTLQGVVKRSKESADGLQPTEFKGYQILRKDELVFKLIDLQNISTSRVGLSPYEGIVSPAYIVLSSNGNYNVAFAEKFFLMMWYNEVWNRLGNDGVRSNLNAFDVLSLPLPVPPLEEQERIATWLDVKCGEIDELIEVEQQMISELEAYRQAVITEAVTKGLNPNVKTKSTSIPWILQIPEHWKLARLKDALESLLQYGANESGTSYSPEHPRYIRITDITPKGGLKEEDKKSLELSVAKPYILEEGDVLFARSGGTVGKAFLYKEEYGQAAYAGYLIRARLDHNKVLPPYLFLFTQSSTYENWKNSIFIQSTIQNIGADKYAYLIIPIPPLSEQEEIVNFLDDKCAEIDDLIKVKQEKIETLKQYRQSLIFEAVTGKITIN